MLRRTYSFVCNRGNAARQLSSRFCFRRRTNTEEFVASRPGSRECSGRSPRFSFIHWYRVRAHRLIEWWPPLQKVSGDRIVTLVQRFAVPTKHGDVMVGVRLWHCSLTRIVVGFALHRVRSRLVGDINLWAEVSICQGFRHPSELYNFGWYRRRNQPVLYKRWSHLRWISAFICSLSRTPLDARSIVRVDIRYKEIARQHNRLRCVTKLFPAEHISICKGRLKRGERVKDFQNFSCRTHQYLPGTPKKGERVKFFCFFFSISLPHQEKLDILTDK